MIYFRDLNNLYKNINLEDSILNCASKSNIFYKILEDNVPTL